MLDKEQLIPKHGGYRKLKSFQVAQLIYDVTTRFCDRYIEKRSRTHDQMVQAARSGVQNIAEGSQAAGTSKKTELKLTNVARASLEELRLDYEDFLRQRGLPVWDRKDRRRESLITRRCTSADCVARWVQEQRGRSGLGGQSGRGGPSGLGGPSGPTKMNSGATGLMNSRARMQSSSLSSTQSTKSTGSTSSTFPEIAANAALVLIAAACSLLIVSLLLLLLRLNVREGSLNDFTACARKRAGDKPLNSHRRNR